MKVAMMVGDTVAVEAGDILVEVEVEVEDAIIVERKGILRETVLILITSERMWVVSVNDDTSAVVVNNSFVDCCIFKVW
jgi:hypothetical protein